jgi:tRNA threonylcarbamoyladenosine biosynthesis protein TsaB
MSVLAIDTVGPVIGVALRHDGATYERVLRQSRGTETLLVPWAKELCAEAGLELKHLTGVAATRGPGSFTGLRVGLATASALATGLNVPLWGASSLQTRALRVRSAAGQSILSVLDARKQRVYAALYAPDGTLLQGPADLPPAEALAWCTTSFLATGEGALVYKELVVAAGGQVHPEAEHPAVDALARMGEEALKQGLGSEPLAVTPLYLRAPDAKPRPT